MGFSNRIACLSWARYHIRELTRPIVLLKSQRICNLFNMGYRHGDFYEKNKLSCFCQQSDDIISSVVVTLMCQLRLCHGDFLNE